MKTTEFFLAMIPPTVTHQQKGIVMVKGKPMFFEKAEVKAARNKFMAALAPHKPAVAYQPPIRLVVKFCFPNGNTHRDGEYRITKPDTDNLLKLFKDCMADSGFFKDDCHVASEHCEKFWAETSGIWVHVAEIKE